MYLRVVNGTKSKDFTLTNQYNQKPYMVVNGNQKLPLTTKPPKDYSSSSESGSFYTTAQNSAGLNSTTALTRASTYETVYGTRASTYNTVYQTINQYQGYSSVSAGYYGNRTDTYIGITGSTLHPEGEFGIYALMSIRGNPMSYTRSWSGGGTERNTSNVDSWVWDDGAIRAYPVGVSVKKTTGTIYLTKVSTSATSYLTRSSISGYQGISSTSTSGSYITAPGGNMFIKIMNGTLSYRPLEYVQSSESATYKTSLVNSLGLSSTTALTRKSTSKTIYDTRASTSKTVYQTINQYQGYSSVSAGYYGNRTDTFIGITGSTHYPSGYFGIYEELSVRGNPMSYTRSWNNYVERNTSNVHSWVWDDGAIRAYPVGVSVKKTTGTKYETRASTYNTRYETRSSISAYSGVSSSSKSTFSWV